MPIRLDGTAIIRPDLSKLQAATRFSKQIFDQSDAAAVISEGAERLLSQTEELSDLTSLPFQIPTSTTPPIAVEAISGTLSAHPAEIVSGFLASPRASVARSSPPPILPTTQASLSPPGTSSLLENVTVSASVGMENAARTSLTRSDTIPEETSSVSVSGSGSTQSGSLISVLDLQFCHRASSIEHALPARVLGTISASPTFLSNEAGHARLVEEPENIVYPNEDPEASTGAPEAEDDRPTEDRVLRPHHRSTTLADMPEGILIRIMDFLDDYESPFTLFKGNIRAFEFRRINRTFRHLLDSSLSCWNVSSCDTHRLRPSEPDTPPNLKNLHAMILDLLSQSNVNCVGKALSFHLRSWIDGVFGTNEVHQHLTLACNNIPRFYVVSITLPDSGSSRETSPIPNDPRGSIVGLMKSLALHHDLIAFSWKWSRTLGRIPNMLIPSQLSLPTAVVSWPHLRKLLLDCQLTFKDCFDALGEFRDTIEVASFGTLQDGPLTTGGSPIVLSKLHTLRLKFGATPFDVGSMFDATVLDTPALRTLELQSDWELFENVQFRPSMAQLQSVSFLDTMFSDGRKILGICHRHVQEIAWRGTPSDLVGVSALLFMEPFPVFERPVRCVLPSNTSNQGVDFFTIENVLSFHNPTSVVKYV